jgi:hypothetical protein
VDIYYLCGGFCGAGMGNVGTGVWIYIICAEVSVGRGWGGDEECCDVLGVSSRCFCCAGKGPRVLRGWLLGSI